MAAVTAATTIGELTVIMDSLPAGTWRQPDRPHIHAWRDDAGRWQVSLDGLCGEGADLAEAISDGISHAHKWQAMIDRGL